MKYYAGIGSRETPEPILKLQTKLAIRLQDDYCLRSGGAPGSDTAFEKGVSNGNKEIFLPWKGFNKNPSLLFEIDDKAYELAAQHHPVWKGLKPFMKKLHARNVYQVLGKNLETPVDFVLCWTADGCESFAERTRATGGTGTAIEIASYRDIPVINMKNENWEIELEKILCLNP